MSVEFYGGPIDGVQEHDEFKAENEIWLIGRGPRFAVYIRKNKPDGSPYYQFDRFCDEKEAAKLRGQYKSGLAGGMPPSI
jgi:hypothetical protein